MKWSKLNPESEKSWQIYLAAAQNFFVPLICQEEGMKRTRTRACIVMLLNRKLLKLSLIEDLSIRENEKNTKLDQILGLNRSARLNGDIKLWTSRSLGL